MTPYRQRIKDRDDAFSSRYLAGEPISDICIALEISGTTAYRIIRARKLKRDPKLAEDWETRRFRAWAEGEPGGVLGVHRRSISIEQLAFKHGLLPRQVRAVIYEAMMEEKNRAQER